MKNILDKLKQVAEGGFVFEHGPGYSTPDSPTVIAAVIREMLDIITAQQRRIAELEAKRDKL